MYANSMGYYYHAGYPIANWGECIPLFLGTFVLLLQIYYYEGTSSTNVNGLSFTHFIGGLLAVTFL